MEEQEMASRIFLTNNGDFFLSKNEWNNLCLSILAIQKSISESPSINHEFQQLIQQANTMATIWQQIIQPNSLLFAKTIATSGATIAQTYGGLADDITALLVTDRREMLARLKQGVAAISSQSTHAQIRATELHQQIIDLANQARNLYRLLNQQAQNYAVSINTNDQDVQRLKHEIEQTQASVNTHQARYNEYVTIAATTPTYAWIPIIGWIAGGTIAGTYGAKASAEKRSLDAASQTLARLVAELSVELQELYQLQRARDTSQSLTQAFAAVTPIFGQIQGIWDAIASDLVGIVRDITDEHDTTWLISLAAALQTSAESWQRVAHAAAAYAQHGTPIVVAPNFDGYYRTQIGYGGQWYTEDHDLLIAGSTVFIHGVSVLNPIFASNSLRFGDQPDARRDAKPVEASIQFTNEGFKGTCRFPGEGPVDWIGLKQ